MDSEFLSTMNRDYDIESSLKDIENLIEIIGNVNIDTMYGFEGEHEDTLLKTISKFIEMGVPMISIYGLDNQRSSYTPSANGPAEDKNRKEKMETFSKAKIYLYNNGFKDILQNIFIKENSVGSYKHQLRRWDNVTLLSMGIGSQGYAPEKIYQNIPDIKQYYEALDKDILPIVYLTYKNYIKGEIKNGKKILIIITTLALTSLVFAIDSGKGDSTLKNKGVTALEIYPPKNKKLEP